MRRWSELSWITLFNTVLVLILLLMVLAMQNRIEALESRLGDVVERDVDLQLSLSQLGTGTWETIREHGDRLAEHQEQIDSLDDFLRWQSSDLIGLRERLEYTRDDIFWWRMSHEGLLAGKALFHVVNWSRGDITIGEGSGRVTVRAQSFHAVGPLLPVSPSPTIRLYDEAGAVLSSFTPPSSMLRAGDLVLVWYQVSGAFAVDPELDIPAVFWDRNSGLAVAVRHLDGSFEPISG